MPCGMEAPEPLKWFGLGVLKKGSGRGLWIGLGVLERGSGRGFS